MASVTERLLKVLRTTGFIVKYGWIPLILYLGKIGRVATGVAGFCSTPVCVAVGLRVSLLVAGAWFKCAYEAVGTA